MPLNLNSSTEAAKIGMFGGNAELGLCVRQEPQGPVTISGPSLGGMVVCDRRNSNFCALHTVRVIKFLPFVE